LKDLAKFLETQPCLFAVFTKDEVAQAAAKAHRGRIHRS
jgi:hypothetical protein